MTIALKAAATLFWPGELKFAVTKKSGDGKDHRAANLGMIRWQIGVAIASVCAGLWAAVAFWTGAAWELSGISLGITLCWALYNAGMIASLARMVLTKHHRRHMYRFDTDLRATVADANVSAPARVEDLSGVGAGWIAPIELATGAIVGMRFETGEAAIETEVRIASRRAHGTGFRYGGEFVALSEATRRQLVLFLYQRHAPSLFGSGVAARSVNGPVAAKAA